MVWQGGARGFIITPEGLLETSFAWGLGLETNNMAEALALWQGLRIANNQDITELTVLEDSRIIIQAINKNLIPNQMHLKWLIHKIKVQALTFSKIKLYHVLRKINKEEDQATNLGSSLSPRELLINGLGSFCFPPIRPGLCP